MAKIVDLLKRPITAGVIGLLVGLIIGLPLLGWGLWPVEWKDADASFLRADLKDQYLCMVIDSFAVNKNRDLAQTRLESLGIDMKIAPSVLETLQLSPLKGGCTYTASDAVVVQLKAALLNQSPSLLPGGTTVPSESLFPTPTAAASKPKSNSTLLLVFLCIAFLALGGGLAYVLLFRNKKLHDEIPPEAPDGSAPYEDEDYDYEEAPAEKEHAPSFFAEPLSGKRKSQAPARDARGHSDNPIAHFVTTYNLGDDVYDDSFSIDALSGEFLGECGVGISETIGVGDPKKVAAFEVWLFDKNDIQTVTKVIMSAHAMNDAATRQRLASKGEPVLLDAGQQILLETATLQLEARVIEMVYGKGALPSQSYFDRVTLELAIWPKN